MDDWRLSALSDPRRRGIGGLLLVFWLSLTVLRPATLLWELSTLARLPLSGTVIAIAVLNLAFTALGVCAGALLWRLDRRGLRLARIYLVLALAFRFSEVVPSVRYGWPTLWFMTARAAVPLLFNLFWLGYLQWSRRVQLTFAPADE